MYSNTSSSIIHNNICDNEQQEIARKCRQLQQRFQVQRREGVEERGRGGGAISWGQAIAIGAIAVKGEYMRRYRLFLVKILHFEVPRVSPLGSSSIQTADPDTSHL